MKIFPVLDLLNQQVVLGVGGLRSVYRPLQNSPITNSAKPIDVVYAFQEKFALKSFYVADLDLIQRTGKSNLELALEISSEGFSIMFDGGVRNFTDLTNILQTGIEQVIVGTETIDSISTIKEAISMYGQERLIISIDLKDGKLLTKSKEISKYSPLELALLVENLGIRSIIVLDLKKVGSQEGPITETVLTILKNRNKLNVLTGGGVRDREDLSLLAQRGVYGALVATAFHKGKITREDLEEFL